MPPTRTNILITGASSGLGEGMAREFAARGRNLALCARRTDRLESLRDELQSAHPGITVAVRALDVTDYDTVFTVFREFDEELAALGGVQRVIVNAGLGKGASLGTGYFRANLQTAQTNFLGALAQCEAALELFRARNAGHLVAISSVAGVRGMRRAQNTYSATKAGLSALMDGVRLDLRGTPITATTISPGYIRSEINAKVDKVPFMIGMEEGARALVRAIDREPAKAYVPTWPWRLIAPALRVAPAAMVAKLS